MFIKLISILFLIISYNLYAKEIKITYGDSYYTLQYSKDLMKLLGPNISLTVSENDCNRDFFNKFYSNLNMNLKNTNIYKVKHEKSIKLEFENKTTYLDRKTAKGRYFLNLPAEFEMLRIKERLKCDSQKK